MTTIEAWRETLDGDARGVRDDVCVVFFYGMSVWLRARTRGGGTGDGATRSGRREARDADDFMVPLRWLRASARVSGGGAGAHAIGLACGGDFGFTQFFSRGLGAHALELLPGRFLLARERGGFGIVLGVDFLFDVLATGGVDDGDFFHRSHRACAETFFGFTVGVRAR